MAFASLRSRISLGLGLVAVACTLAMVLGIGPPMEDFAARSITDRLLTARKSFQRYLESRLGVLESMVASVAETPRLKATLASETVDRAAVKPLAGTTRSVLDVDLVVLTDAQGRPLANAKLAGVSDIPITELLITELPIGTLPPSDPPISGLPMVQNPLQGKRHSGLFEADTKLYLVASAPVMSNRQILGVLIAGILVDTDIANEFREVVSADVLIFSGSRVITNSDPRHRFDPSTFARALLASNEPMAEVRRIKSDSLDRFAVAHTLDKDVFCVFSRSAAELVELQYSLWKWVTGVAALAAALAVLFGHWISKLIANPLRELVTAADRVADGDLNTVVGESSMRETARLGRAFNHMTARVRRLVDDGRRKAEVLRDQRDELEWSNQVKNNFLISASHELRTPITNITSSVEILNEHGAADDVATRNEFLRIIAAEAQRVSGLLKQMLEVTRIEAGATQLNFAAFDLRELIEEIHGAFVHGPGAGRPVTRHYTGELDACVADRSRIRDILEQLLDNVVRFTPAGSPIEIEVLADAEQFEVRVADRGPGFESATQRERIFERFVQGGDILTEKPSGVGLGLSIARDMAHAHSGDLRCEDRQGGGSVFVLSVPATLVVDTDADTAAGCSRQVDGSEGKAAKAGLAGPGWQG